MKKDEELKEAEELWEKLVNIDFNWNEVLEKIEKKGFIIEESAEGGSDIVIRHCHSGKRFVLFIEPGNPHELVKEVD